MAINIIPQANHAPRSHKKWASEISRTIYRQTLVAHEKPYADFYLNPTLGYGANFNKKAALTRIEIGYQQTLELMARIKQNLAPV